MSPRTRSKAPANRVYKSPLVRQQVTFKPRKKGVAARESLDTERPSRQETLTQMDFVNLRHAMDNNNEEEQSVRKAKRRRTEDDAPSSSSKFHTQTLTQLEFVSTPCLRQGGLSDEENDIRIPSSHQEHKNLLGPTHDMGPPKTPNRRRVFEVPSSQSPSSPASAPSRRSSPRRSPLKALDINQHVQGSSPLRREAAWGSPKVKSEITDTFEYEDGSQQSRVLQTPTDSPSPSPAKATVSTTVPQSTIDRQSYKDEIQDSEEDEDLEPYYDGLVQESQFNKHAANPRSSDTQEPENQLQGIMLQFTQIVPSAFIKEEPAAPRLSQATTVSLSQPPSSSPIWTRLRNNTQHAKAMEGLDTQPGLYGVPMDTNTNSIVISDPPSHQLIPGIDLSLSPIIPRLPIEFKSQEGFQTQNDIKDNIQLRGPMSRTEESPIPVSIASSQLLTRSQMLPESLMNDSVPPPPSLRFLVEDSEED